MVHILNAGSDGSCSLVLSAWWFFWCQELICECLWIVSDMFLPPSALFPRLSPHFSWTRYSSNLASSMDAILFASNEMDNSSHIYPCFTKAPPCRRAKAQWTGPSFCLFMLICIRKKCSMHLEAQVQAARETKQWVFVSLQCRIWQNIATQLQGLEWESSLIPIEWSVLTWTVSQL